MLFWLKKLVGFWLMPLPLSLALLVIGFVLWNTQRFRRLGRTLVGGGILWLLLFSNAGIGGWMLSRFERTHPPIAEFTAGEALPPAVARCRFVAVLGGGHDYSPAWSATGQLSTAGLARIVEGVRLMRHLPEARLIVSGPGNPRGGPSHAQVLAEAAMSLGIERNRIIEVDTARDTEDEAAAIRRIAGEAPVALVTSAWHMPRAVGLCRRQQVDTLPCPADFMGRPFELPASEFRLWNLGGLERSTKAFYETFGLTWVKLRGKA